MSTLPRTSKEKEEYVKELLKKEKPSNWDKVFEKELYLITDKKIREFTLFCLDNAPPYFYFSGASLTGKYHSGFGQGEGGLVRHTRALCYFVREFVVETDTFGLNSKFDLIISAGILHDLFKYGVKMTREEYLHHGEIAAVKIYEWGKGLIDEEKLSEICNLVFWHMGKYESHINTFPWQDRVVRKSHQLIQICDIASSRRDLDIIGLFDDQSLSQKKTC